MSTRDHPDWWRPVGGQNSQDSTLERRSLVWNDDGILNGAVPDDFYEHETFIGKFFTRGCRGMIEQLQLYCIGDGVDAITLRYSPHPCIGPFGDVTLVPAAAWAWQNFNIEEMWNYDSLFIWVYTTEANVDWAYDTVLPYDGHESEDAGATWEDMAIRPFIRAIYTGETPGDVPVSGIINTIEIPAVATSPAGVLAKPLGNAAYTTVTGAEGAGTLLGVNVEFYTTVVPTPGIAPAAVVYMILIRAEGGNAYVVTNRDLTQSCVATSGRNSIGEFFQCTIAEDSWDRTFMNVRMPVKFRRSIDVMLYQSTGAPTTVDARIWANMVR